MQTIAEQANDKFGPGWQDGPVPSDVSRIEFLMDTVFGWSLDFADRDGDAWLDESCRERITIAAWRRAA